MKRKIITAAAFLGLCLAMPFCLSSCGREGDQAGNPDYVYVAGQLDLPGEKEAALNPVELLRTSGGWVYFKDDRDGGVYRFQPETGNEGFLNAEPVLDSASLWRYAGGHSYKMRQTYKKSASGYYDPASPAAPVDVYDVFEEFEYEMYIADYVPDGEQGIYFILGLHRLRNYVGDMNDADNADDADDVDDVDDIKDMLLLVKWTPAGEEAYQLNLSEMNLSDAAFRGESLALDGKGRIWIMGRDSIYLVDAEGRPGGEIPTKDLRRGDERAEGRLLMGAEGDVFYCLESNGWRSLYFLGEDGRLEETGAGLMVKSPETYGNIYGDRILESGKGLLYVDSGGALSLYDRKENRLEAILDLEDSSLSIVYGLRDALYVDDVHLLLFFEEGGSTGLLAEAYLLTKTAVSDLPRKEELVLVSANPSKQLERAVAEFNLGSDQYRIRLETMTELQLDSALAAGNVPDLLDMWFYSDLYKYASKGVLEDLGPYLDASSRFHREDFLENVLEGYTLYGKLVSIPVCFYIDAFWGRKSQAGDGEDWNMEKFMGLAQQYPGEALLNEDALGCSLLEACIPYMLDHFADWEGGTCSYDSGEFKELAAWIGEHSRYKEYDENGSWEDNMYDFGETILHRESVMNPSDFGKNDLFAGEEGVWLGYPEEGDSACRGVAKDTLCMAAASRHKEGAWSFLESWLGAEIGYGARVENGFMTRKRELYQMFEEEATPLYRWSCYDSATDQIVFYEGAEPPEGVDSYRVSRETIGMIGIGFFEYYGLSGEQMENALDLLERLDFAPEDSGRLALREILTEELEIYYSGAKTLQEVADIIQSRATLLVSEGA